MTASAMETFTVKLTQMTHGGAALGRVEGKVVFVPYALPGETIRAEMTDDRGRYAHARLLEVLEPSPDRVSPPCPYFGPEGCGGCHWQHAAYAAQLRFKAEIVRDQLARIGRMPDPPVRSTLPDRTGWSYRNQARLHRAADGELGFRSAGSHRVVRVEECMTLHPLLSELYDSIDLDLPELQALTMRAGAGTGDRMLVLETRHDEPPALHLDLPVSCVLLLSGRTAVNLIGHNHITEVVGGTSYRVSASSFFQINTAQAESLVRLAVDYLDVRQGEAVLDGYCGVGLFTLPLAERASLVTAVEVAPQAVADLLENTEALDNVEVVEGSLGLLLSDLDEALDAALVDPPRAGLERDALDGLIATRPRRIVYVSCDPATLARDGRQLSQNGYRLVEVQPVDMFPQTHHIETVSLWVRGT